MKGQSYDCPFVVLRAGMETRPYIFIQNDIVFCPIFML